MRLRAVEKIGMGTPCVLFIGSPKVSAFLDTYSCGGDCEGRRRAACASNIRSDQGLTSGPARRCAFGQKTLKSYCVTAKQNGPKRQKSAIPGGRNGCFFVGESGDFALAARPGWIGCSRRKPPGCPATRLPTANLAVLRVTTVPLLEKNLYADDPGLAPAVTRPIHSAGASPPQPPHPSKRLNTQTRCILRGRAPASPKQLRRRLAAYPPRPTTSFTSHRATPRQAKSLFQICF